MKIAKAILVISLSVSLFSTAFAGDDDTNISVKCTRYVKDSIDSADALSAAVMNYELIAYGKDGPILDADGNTVRMYVTNASMVDDGFDLHEDKIEIEDRFLALKITESSYESLSPLTAKLKPRDQGENTTIKSFFDVQANSYGEIDHDGTDLDEGSGDFHEHLFDLVDVVDATNGNYSLGVGYAYLHYTNNGNNHDLADSGRDENIPYYMFFYFAKNDNSSNELRGVCIQDLDA
ncbi:MAG: hypothetical protein KBD83_03725 [Gammaproteobacteria bacterium]|nr:hypothetical protein [Gammaproteobacteria bacterium]